MGRKHCGCPLRYQDRTHHGCENPGECIETVKILIDSIFPKWDPATLNCDLREEFILTEGELEWNRKPIEPDQLMVFDPDFALSDIESGFRIFAFEDSLKEISARRYKLSGVVPSLILTCTGGAAW
jgi:hypothetical protein